MNFLLIIIETFGAIGHWPLFVIKIFLSNFFFFLNLKIQLFQAKGKGKCFQIKANLIVSSPRFLWRSFDGKCYEFFFVHDRICSREDWVYLLVPGGNALGRFLLITMSKLRQRVDPCRLGHRISSYIK